MTLLKTQNIRELIKLAYGLSKPQGLGFLHFMVGDIDATTLDSMVDSFEQKGRIDLDYVIGRACKCSFTKSDDGILTSIAPDMWYDHTDDQANQFLSQAELL